jgi:transcription initiation factor TFIID subunit 7
MSDSELIEHEEAVNPTTPGPPGSEAGDAATPGIDHGEGGGEGEGEDEDEGDGDIDEELAAELDLALGDEDEGRDDEDDDEDDDESEEEDEDDDDESAQSRKLLNEEIRDLEVAIMKKENEIASSANPLIKVRVINSLCSPGLISTLYSADSKML